MKWHEMDETPIAKLAGAPVSVWLSTMEGKIVSAIFVNDHNGGAGGQAWLAEDLSEVSPGERSANG